MKANSKLTLLLIVIIGALYYFDHYRPERELEEHYKRDSILSDKSFSDLREVKWKDAKIFQEDELLKTDLQTNLDINKKKLKKWINFFRQIHIVKKVEAVDKTECSKITFVFKEETKVICLGSFSKISDKFFMTVNGTSYLVESLNRIEGTYKDELEGSLRYRAVREVFEQKADDFINYSLFDSDIKRIEVSFSNQKPFSIDFYNKNVIPQLESLSVKNNLIDSYKKSLITLSINKELKEKPENLREYTSIRIDQKSVVIFKSKNDFFVMKNSSWFQLNKKQFESLDKSYQDFFLKRVALKDVNKRIVPLIIGSKKSELKATLDLKKGLKILGKLTKSQRNKFLKLVAMVVGITPYSEASFVNMKRPKGSVQVFSIDGQSFNFWIQPNKVIISEINGMNYFYYNL